ncbi:tegument protein VP11/12 [Equid alphaherpesvirus 4]|uniref:Tegument protein UL46 homolog n=1 Tax=Equid alphaherpesvirus 4 TaxID=10331 RepID=A0A0Y0A3E6_9ALPH|nr:tegument protein VP11/12 [Equid alphaherpesvirus 4]BAV93063.1 tegument protein VP11/12 [Equid alphaherpesvirus 4]BAV93458.1 tegument protein VP11/12 [Equid alphaherpesvirus 4]
MEASGSASWARVSKNLIERRAVKGCILPTPSDVMDAAVMALKDATENVVSKHLFSVDRTNALSVIHTNAVPESIITTAILRDTNGEYRREYEDSAKCNLAATDLSQDGMWEVVIKSYWRYLRESSGAEVVDRGAVGNTTQSVLSVLILQSTFGKKRLSKNPFKHKGPNVSYKSNLENLRAAFTKIEKYMYYMRPNDPMTKSEDTELRLHELLAYVATCYRWLLWFMDLTDAKVLKNIDKGPVITHGPRETRPPDELVRRHLKSGPAISAGTGDALTLSTATADALIVLLRMSVSWTSHSWKSNTHGVTGAIVAAVELVTLIHHHLQYIINTIFAGYVCWLDGGVENSYLNSALRNQGRFDHFAGKLVPIMATLSWANMEKGTVMWFKYALAKSIVCHGSPTQHYLTVLDSIASKRTGAGLPPGATFGRTANFQGQFGCPPQGPLPAPPNSKTKSMFKRPGRGSVRSLKQLPASTPNIVSSATTYNAGGNTAATSGQGEEAIQIRASGELNDCIWYLNGTYSHQRSDSSSSDNSSCSSTETEYITISSTPSPTREVVYTDPLLGSDEEKDASPQPANTVSEYSSPANSGYMRPRSTLAEEIWQLRDSDYTPYMRPSRAGRPRLRLEDQTLQTLPGCKPPANSPEDNFEDTLFSSSQIYSDNAHSTFRPRARCVDDEYGLTALAALSASQAKARRVRLGTTTPTSANEATEKYTTPSSGGCIRRTLSTSESPESSPEQQERVSSL